MGKTKKATMPVTPVLPMLDVSLQPSDFGKTAKKYVPDEEEIQAHIGKCAYYKWQNAGYPDGQHDRFWIEAEQEIRSKYVQ